MKETTFNFCLSKIFLFIVNKYSIFKVIFPSYSFSICIRKFKYSHTPKLMSFKAQLNILNKPNIWKWTWAVHLAKLHWVLCLIFLPCPVFADSENFCAFFVSFLNFVITEFNYTARRATTFYHLQFLSVLLSTNAPGKQSYDLFDTFLQDTVLQVVWTVKIQQMTLLFKGKPHTE